MLRIWIAAFILFSSLSDAVAADTCAQIHTLKNTTLQTLQMQKCALIEDSGFKAPPGLPALWSQMRVGADLVREKLKDMETYGGIKSRAVSVGNIDGGFNIHDSSARGNAWEQASQSNLPNMTIGPWDYTLYNDHGTRVANILAGTPEDGGASSKARLDFIRGVYDRTGGIVDAMNEAVSISKPPEVLNLEMQTLSSLKGNFPLYGETPAIAKALKTVSKKTIAVAAAGNYYPAGSGERLLPEDSDLIVVGCADGYGLICDFSDESPDVTLVAPASTYQNARGNNNKVFFGGTSGATPLVSAAIADVKSVLNDLTPREAIEILKISSTKLPITTKSKQNGAGQLNSYRALFIAERLKKMGWPQDREALLKKAKSWDFKDLAQQELESARKLLKQNSCGMSKLAFNSLRKAVLLDESSPARDDLAILYEAQGYTVESQYLRNLNEKNLNAFLQNPLAQLSCTKGDCDASSASVNAAPANAGYGTESFVIPSQKAITRAQNHLLGIDFKKTTQPPPPSSTSPTR